MANIDRPNGFRPAKSLTGAPITGLLRKYTAGDGSADATNAHGDIYIGDPVKLVAGLVLPANSGDTILGVVVGVGKASTFGDSGPFNPSNLEERYIGYADTAAGDRDVWVCPAEGTLFEVQTATDIDLVAGSQADINSAAATAHGSQTTGVSNVELVVASNNDVEVVEDVTAPDNDTTLINARHFVQFLVTQHTA